VRGSETLPADDCVLIMTDHSAIYYRSPVQESQLVFETRNATRGIVGPKFLRF
jgi:UDP-N-acetyl-D-glucosamine dehydrogenase